MAIETVGTVYEELAREALAREGNELPWMEAYLADALRALDPPSSNGGSGTAVARLARIFSPYEPDDKRFALPPALSLALKGLESPLSTLADGAVSGHRAVRVAQFLQTMRGQWGRYDAALAKGFRRWTVPGLLDNRNVGPVGKGLLPTPTSWNGVHFPTGMTIEGGRIHYRSDDGCSTWVLTREIPPAAEGEDFSPYGFLGPQAVLTKPSRSGSFEENACDVRGWVFKPV